MNGMQFINPIGTVQPQMQSPYVNPYMNKFLQSYPTNSTPIQNNGIIWVQGIEGAKAYQLAPNSNVLLLDSDTDGVFYIKVSDNVGMCTLRIFNYSEVTNTSSQQEESQSQIDMSNYITRDEFNEMIKKISGGNLNGEQSVSTNERNAKSNNTR